MGLFGELADMLPDTVTVRTRTGMKDTGQPTYDDGVAYPCRVVRKPRLVRKPDGREILNSATVQFAADVGVTEQDSVVLPDGSEPLIIEVHSFPDESGDKHQEVLL